MKKPVSTDCVLRILILNEVNKLKKNKRVLDMNENERSLVDHFRLSVSSVTTSNVIILLTIHQSLSDRRNNRWYLSEPIASHRLVDINRGLWEAFDREHLAAEFNNDLKGYSIDDFRVKTSDKCGRYVEP